MPTAALASFGRRRRWSVHVAKFLSAVRFVFVTPDAEVEVRGTRFHVAIAAADENCRETTTRVVVDEGVVVVRSAGRSSRVAAGARWPAECSEPPEAAAPSAPIGRSAGASESARLKGLLRCLRRRRMRVSAHSTLKAH